MSIAASNPRLDDIETLEAVLAEDGVGGLRRALARAVADLPAGKQRRIFGQIDRALGMDAWFLARYPDALFQCLWYRLWWLDSPRAAEFYKVPAESGPEHRPPWEHSDAPLHGLLESWLADKKRREPDFVWLRPLHPPPLPLGTGAVAEMWLADDSLGFAASRDSALFDEPVIDQFNIGFDGDGHLVMLQTWRGRLQDGSGEHGLQIEQVCDWRSGCVVARSEGVCGPRPPYGYIEAPGGRWIARYSDLDVVEVRDVVDLIDAATGEVMATLERPEMSGVFAIAFSADLRWLAVGGWAGECRGWLGVWELSMAGDTVVAHKRWEHLPDDTVYSLCFSRCGERLLWSSGAIAEVWNVAGGEPLGRLLGHRATIDDTALDGDLAATISKNGQAIVWDLAEAAQDPIRRASYEDVYAAAIFSPDGTRLLISPWLWDGTTGALVVRLAETRTWYLAGGPPRRSRFMSDELIVKLEVRARAWRTRNGDELAVQERNWSYTSLDLIAFHPSGERHAVARKDRGQLRLIETLSGHQKWAREVPAITCLEISPDGRLLATGSGDEDCGVRLWDAASGELRALLGSHGAAVNALAFSCDGSHLASAATGEELRIWDVASGQQVAARPVDRRDGETRVYISNSESELVPQWQPTARALAALDRMLWPPGASQPPGRPAGFRSFASPPQHEVSSGVAVTEIVEVATGHVVARLPGPCELVSHPARPIWADMHWHVALESQS